MRFTHLGWMLIAILLLNLSAGVLQQARPQKNAVEKPDAATSEAGIPHFPANFDLDGDASSLSAAQVCSSTATVGLGPADELRPSEANGNRLMSSAYVQFDPLQLQHAFRI
jgi:hypothetical protein